MKYQRLCIIIATCCLLSFGYASTSPLVFQWAISIGESDNCTVHTMKVDVEGNVVIAGEYFGTVDFDPGSEVHSLQHDKGKSLFIAKYSSDGHFLWVKGWGSSYDGVAYGIFIDPYYANVYVTGVATETQFDKTLFMRGFKANGEGLLWSLRLNETPLEGITLEIDNNDNLILCGHYTATTILYNTVAKDTLIAEGATDIFFAKFDKQGELLWAKSIGGKNNDFVKDVLIDQANNIYLTGTYYRPVDFDPDSGEEIRHGAGHYYGDLYLAKYDTSGRLLWVNTFGGSDGNDQDMGYELALTEDGSIYLAGVVSGSTFGERGAPRLSANKDDILLAKYDSSGTLHWAHSIGGGGYEIAKYVKTSEADVFSAGEFTLRPGFDTIVDFDPGILETLRKPKGGTDIFVMQFDSSGTFKWVETIGGNYDDALSGLDIDRNRNIYLAGMYRNTVDFDLSNNVHELISLNGPNVFIAKYGEAPLDVRAPQHALVHPVFPNPVSDIATISVSEDEHLLAIVDVTGRNYRIDAARDHSQVRMHVRDLIPGIYTALISSLEGTRPVKFVKK